MSLMSLMSLMRVSYVYTNTNQKIILFSLKKKSDLPVDIAIYIRIYVLEYINTLLFIHRRRALSALSVLSPKLTYFTRKNRV